VKAVGAATPTPSTTLFPAKDIPAPANVKLIVIGPVPVYVT